MTVSLRKVFSYVAILLAGAGMYVYLVPSLFSTQSSTGKTGSIEKDTSLTYSCVDTKNETNKDIYFVSCGGFY